jgi:hypothetical protein
VGVEHQKLMQEIERAFLLLPRRVGVGPHSQALQVRQEKTSAIEEGQVRPPCE